MKLNKLSSPILMTALGLFLLLMPGLTATLLVRIIGGALLIMGGIQLLAHIKEVANPDTARAAICAVGGLVLLVMPSLVTSFIPFLAGAVLLLMGISKMLDASKMEAGQSKNTAIGMAAIPMIAGVVLFFNPFGTLSLLIRIFGAFMIYNGVTGFITLSKD